MYNTVPLIVTSKQPAGAFACLNGLRVLAMCWIILGHSYVIGTSSAPFTIGQCLGSMIE